MIGQDLLPYLTIDLEATRTLGAPWSGQLLSRQADQYIKFTHDKIMMSRHAQPAAAGASRKESRPSTPADLNYDQDYDQQRRSFSDATPRPTPSPSRPLGQDSNTPSNLTAIDSLLPPSSRRLGFFTDKLSGSSSSQSQSHHTQSQSTSGHRASPIPSGLLPPRSHSRADSAPRDPLTMASNNASTSNLNKPHTSPSKVSSSAKFLSPLFDVRPSGEFQSTTGRTYDARLVSREMHRLGNLSHLPTHLPASLAASASNLNLPTTVSSSTLPSTSSGKDDSWGSLHVHVLPLFNGEPLRVPM